MMLNGSLFGYFDGDLRLTDYCNEASPKMFMFLITVPKKHKTAPNNCIKNFSHVKHQLHHQQ